MAENTEAKNVKELEFEGKSYRVIKPNQKIQRESDPIYMKAFRDALSSGYFIGAEIDKLLDDMGLDVHSIEEKKEGIRGEIQKLEERLLGEDYKNIDEGKQIALSIKDKRQEIDDIEDPKRELEGKSAHMQAENRRFSYYAYACIQDMDGNRLWGSFEEFENDDSELAIKAANELLLLVYNVNKDQTRKLEANLVENRWLIDNGFMNEDCRFIDDKGRLITREGRLIDEEGYYINEEGHRINKYGHLVDEDGNVIKEGRNKESKSKKTTKKTKAADKVTEEETVSS